MVGTKTRSASKYIVHDRDEYVRAMLELEKRSLIDDFNESVSDVIESTPQYLDKFLVMVERVEEHTGESDLRHTFGFAEIFIFVRLAEKKYNLAPASVYQYRSAAKQVLSSLGRPLSSEADRLLGLAIKAYQVRWCQEVAVGVRELPADRGTITRPMVDQLAQVAKSKFPGSKLDDGFRVLLEYGVRPQDIRDLCVNRIVFGDKPDPTRPKLLQYVKGGSVKMVNQHGNLVKEARTEAGYAALKRLHEHGIHLQQRYKFSLDTPLIKWDATHVRQCIDHAIKQFNWNKNLQYVAHSIRHGACQEAHADADESDPGANQELDPNKLSAKKCKAAQQHLGWTGSDLNQAENQRYGRTNRETVQDAKKRTYGGKKVQQRIVARNANAGKTPEAVLEDKVAARSSRTKTSTNNSAAKKSQARKGAAPKTKKK